MTASEIRALFAVASRPEVVSLAGGMPYLAALPLDSLAAEAAELVAREGLVALQYGSGQGIPQLREQICEVMALEGIEAHPDDVVVTVGSQMALDLVTRIFCDPGDVVLAEGPSYVGALGTFAAYQARGRARRDGRRRADPRGAARGARAASRRRPAGQVPLHDPELPQPGRRDAVRRPAAPRSLAICRGAGVAVVEDNPYGLLGFRRAHRTRRCARIDPDNVVYLGSFSKTFAPGLRVGWVLAPHAVREKLVLAAESATLCPPMFNQMLVSRYLADARLAGPDQDLPRGLPRAPGRDARARWRRYLPDGARGHIPDGGFYVWVTVPEGIDTKAMLPRAVTARVAYVPGTGFYADGLGCRQLRLSYCYPTPERIREGVRRLAGVLEAELELQRHVRPTLGRVAAVAAADTRRPDTA